MDQLSKNSETISSCQQQLPYNRNNNIRRKQKRESTLATKNHHKINKVVTTKDNDVNVPINTSLADFDITSQEFDKTTNISISPPKKKKYRRTKKKTRSKK